MKKHLALAAILAISACDQLAPQTEAAPAVAPAINKAEIEQIIADYLINNPEKIIESVEKYQEKLTAEEQQSLRKNIVENKDKILSAKQSITLNAGAGSNYVIEFFDYNCGYCKRATPSVNQLIAEKKDVKIVFVEFPVLGPSSELAAKAALAVHFKRPEKYFEFHNKLMAHNGQKDLATLKLLASEIGLADFNLEEEIKAPEVEAGLVENRQFGETLGIRGTPAFIINDELIPGAIPFEDIVKIIEETSQAKAALETPAAPEMAPEAAPTAEASEVAPAPEEKPAQ